MAKMAARANASAGTRVASPNAAHMATTAYGLQAPRKPIQTATDSYGEEAFTHIHRRDSYKVQKHDKHKKISTT